MAVEYPGELTAALAVEEEVVDGFGTGVVQGFISVTGVSDSLLNATSQEAAIQEALCELSPCPDGLESVVVVQESESTRMLLGGGVRQRRRRRLADLVDVQFEISTASGVEDDGEEQTGSQQAASVFNQMADPDALLMVASVFEVGVEDISFEELQYHEGAEVTIAAEFELASTKSDSGGLSVAVGTIVIIVMVIGVLVPLVGCILCCIKQHRREKKRREDAYYARTASHKAQVSAFYSAEDNGRAGSGRRESRSASIGSSGQFGDRATRTPSLGLGFKPTTRTPPVTSAGEMHADDPDKFSHTNPMLNNKRPVAQNVSFGEALKNHYQEDDANVEYNSSAEQLPTMTGDPPPVMDKSLVLSSQTATLSRGRGTASSLTLQRSSAAAVAAAAVDAAARATASAASDFNSDQSGVTLGESETKSKVALTSRDPSQGASTDDNANQEVKTVATADISSTAWDVENRYTRGGVDRDYARGGNGSFGGAGGRGGSYSGSYGSGDFDQDSLTSSSSVMTVRPLQPALAMQSNGSTASAVTPRDESPTGGFAAFGGSPTGMSDVVTVQEPRSDTMSEGVEWHDTPAGSSRDSNALYMDKYGTDAMQRHGWSGPKVLKAEGNEASYPRLEQHGLGCVSPRDEELEGEAFVSIGRASGRTAEAADTDSGDADNAAGPLEMNRSTNGSGEACTAPAGGPTAAVSTVADENIRASSASPSPQEPPTPHLTESKTAESGLTVVTMVPLVSRYHPANGVSQEVVTPREDLGASLSLKVPPSPLQASAYGGEKSVPALIRKEYFRTSGERGSLSLSRSFSSSELDYDRAQQKEAHAGDGRRVLGATLTLRQHLADPSDSSRSYCRQDSYESSISSCASLSLSFKGDPSQWGNPVGETKASATTEKTAVSVTAVQKVDAPKPALENEPIETGISAASMAGLGPPAQNRNHEEAMAANAGATIPKKVVDRSFLVQFPVLPQDDPRDGTSAKAIAARRARSFSSRSSGTLGSLSLSQSFSSEDLDYETDFTRRDEKDSENKDRGPGGVRITQSQQDTSREGAKGAAPTTGTAAAVKAEEPGADANKNASILSAYHPLLAKRTTSNSAAQIDVSWK